MIECATVGATRIEILLNEFGRRRGAGPGIGVPLDPAVFAPSPGDHPPRGEAQQPLRAMRTKAREGFIKALRDAHRWLDELLFDPTHTIESLAVREGKSERSIRMTLSLAFLSPVLTESAIEGRLPRGFCVKRLIDLPMLWSEQWRDLGLQEPVQAGAELGRSIPRRFRAANPPVVLKWRLSPGSGLSISWSGKRNFAG